MFRKPLFLFSVLCFFSFCIFLIAEPLPNKPLGHITDITKTLSEQEILSLDEQAQSIERDFSHQVYVLVANSLDGQPLEQVTIALAEQWKVGRKGLDNGLILFFFLQDRKVRIEVGYGLEGIITDALANQIIQNGIVPKMKERDLASAIGIALQSFHTAFASGDQGIDSASTNFNNQNFEEESKNMDLMFYGSLGIIGLICFYWFWMKRGFKERTFARPKPDPKILESKALATLEFLKDSNPFWAQNKMRYDASAVESKREELWRMGNELLQSWKIQPEKEEAKLVFWISDVEKIQKRPKEFFPLSTADLASRIQTQWKELSWDSWKSQFSQESLTYQKKEWEKRKATLIASKDAKEMEKFLELLKQVRRSPEMYFYPEWNTILSDTETWVQDKNTWSQYKSKYKGTIFAKHEELVEERLKEWKAKPPTDPEEKLKANRFWLINVVSVRSQPESFFKNNSVKTRAYEKGSGYVASDGGSSSSYSSSSSSWSSSSSSSSSSGSSSSSRGGGFGGGGASGGW